MSYLSYVAVFGVGAVLFLWLRDARIFFRTGGLAGYRKAAYHGVIYGALAIAGGACAIFSLELLGLGLILAALYLQARIEREKIWGSERTIERLIGNVPVQRANKK
jgi:hypothetical protein